MVARFAAALLALSCGACHPDCDLDEAIAERRRGVVVLDCELGSGGSTHDCVVEAMADRTPFLARWSGIGFGGSTEKRAILGRDVDGEWTIYYFRYSALWERSSLQVKTCTDLQEIAGCEPGDMEPCWSCEGDEVIEEATCD